MTLQEVSTTVDVPRGAFRRTPAAAWGATLARGQELLLSLQQILPGTPATAGRTLSPVRTAKVKYDGDVLHIIKQYPGCDDARVLGVIRARVPWFGRGTFIGKIFRPSLSSVHAAGHRLEGTGKIKTRVDQSADRQVLRFYPNNPVWANLGLKN